MPECSAATASSCHSSFKYATFIPGEQIDISERIIANLDSEASAGIESTVTIIAIVTCFEIDQ